MKESEGGKALKEEFYNTCMKKRKKELYRSMSRNTSKEHPSVRKQQEP